MTGTVMQEEPISREKHAYADIASTETRPHGSKERMSDVNGVAMVVTTLSCRQYNMSWMRFRHFSGL